MNDCRHKNRINANIVLNDYILNCIGNTLPLQYIDMKTSLCQLTIFDCFKTKSIKHSLDEINTSSICAVNISDATY